MVIPGWIETVKGAVSGLFGEGGIGKIIDDVTTNKEERGEIKAKLDKIQNDFQEKVMEIALEQEKLKLEEMKAYLADTQDARKSNAEIQNSDKASWLSKNVAYCIDIFVIIIWGFLTIYLIGNSLKIIKTSQVDLTGIYGLYAAVTGVAMTIINFHRGSSRGSEDKQKHLNEMMKK